MLLWKRSSMSSEEDNTLLMDGPWNGGPISSKKYKNCVLSWRGSQLHTKLEWRTRKHLWLSDDETNAKIREVSLFKLVDIYESVSFLNKLRVHQDSET